MDFDSYPQKSSSVDKLRGDGITKPRSDRFSPDAPGFVAAMERHQLAVEADSPGYLDPTSGLFVMTAAHLSDRGYCCDRGCRHCPFERKAPTD